jgi:hypothetical protein
VTIAKEAKQMAEDTIHPCMDSRKRSDEKDEAAIKRMRARGRIGNLNKLMAVRQWDVLPQGRRGQRILRWACHHVWRAADRNPERSVRNFCRKRAPYLKPAEVDQLVAATADGCTTWWSNDDSAAVLEVGVCEREANTLWFIGACDDPDYEMRNMVKAAKAMMRARRRRAAKSTGRPRGRPATATGLRRRGKVTRSEYLANNSTSKTRPWIALGISRATYYRRNGCETGPPENASRYYKGNTSVTELNDAPVSTVKPAFERGASQAPPSHHPECEIIVDSGVGLRPPPPRSTVTRLEEVPNDGLILDEDGVGYVPPELLYQQRRPKTWMDAAFEGYRGERS